MKEYIPIITAGISACVLLFGYIYQKHKERIFEINKTRQEIYTRLIKNLSEKLELLEQLQDDPEMPEKVTIDNSNDVMTMIAKKYPNLDRNFNEGREIMSLMALYASDEAIQACANFYRQSYASMQPNSSVHPDKNILIQDLRRSIFPRTQISLDDIKFITSK